MHERELPLPGDARDLNYLTDMILGYLAENPQAMETVEGIAEWWICRQEARTVAHSVARIVRRLTEAGILEQIGTGPNSRFRLARSEK